MPKGGKHAYTANEIGGVSTGLLGSDYINDTKTHHAGKGTDDGSNTYHPGVRYWYVVFPTDESAATPIFDTTKCSVTYDGTAFGDKPQSLEEVPSRGWYGPLTTIGLTQGTVRAYRG